MEVNLPLPSGLRFRMGRWSALLDTLRHLLRDQWDDATSATALEVVGELADELQMLSAQSDAASAMELTSDGPLELGRSEADHDREGRDREQLRQVRDVSDPEIEARVYRAHATAKKNAAQAFKAGRKKSRRSRRRRVK